MTNKTLSTDAYKGVRDFYPADMAIQRYIFDTWAKTAEQFGFERYDASILEPSELYKAKGAENEEMVNEQTYTFTDRGDREVTLRPEMTPTVARMIAAKQRELAFPVRWYSIPNLFRYERPQRGRLREHWQLNCDIFGGDRVAADVELISLAYQALIAFGATPDMFEIRINNREEMTELFSTLNITDPNIVTEIIRLNDRKHKITPESYCQELATILSDKKLAAKVTTLVEDATGENDTLIALRKIGITNVILDRTIARGFDYYTGTVFEFFDTAADNNRALIGGGRYDNLTGMFSNEPVSGIGFGMGDVTMRDFLETHNLLPTETSNTAATIAITPIETEQNLPALAIAQAIREQNISVSIDTSTKKVGEKIKRADTRNNKYVIVLGEEEVARNIYTLKELQSGQELTGTIIEICTYITNQKACI